MSPITGYVSGCLGSVQVFALDPATIAWVNAVIANGGTVSNGRQTIVNNLIVGLKSDGVFAKLDRLWLFAGENAASALTDIIADTLATAVNSPTLATDRGYTGNGTNSYIDTNFNPTTATSPNFVQDSACIFSWSNTSGTNAKPWIFGQGTGAGTGTVQLAPSFTDNNTYWAVNRTGGSVAFGDTTGNGFYLGNRTGSTSASLDLNGTQLTTNATASTAVVNADLVALTDGAGSYGLRQCSAMGFGGQLTSGDRTNIYNRMRTYMTAVGVP